MKKNFAMRTVALSLGTVLGLGFFAGCGGGEGDPLPAYKDNLVIMTEDLNGLFNPFYSTAGTDMDVVGQTQISMLSTDENGNLSYGNNEACLVLDTKKQTNAEGNTEYYYVLKNGLKFSNGDPVTMNDVLFNMYVYLDPAYTGSTTMYSTKILGLQSYRTQTYVPDDGETAEDETGITASLYAANRILELTELFESLIDTKGGKYTATEAEMKTAISTHVCNDTYLTAIGETDPEKAKEQLLADYEDSLKKFREELENDYKSARNSYNDAPYDTVPVYYNGTQVATGFSEIIAFLYHENYVDMTDDCYGKNENGGVDKTQIIRVNLIDDPRNFADSNAVITKVYNDTVLASYSEILNYWATGTQMRTEFAAKAREIILHQNLGSTGLKYKNISGIVSLGHTEDDKTVQIGDNTYTVAHEHDPVSGAPVNEGEYDVLRITIKGIDPKAEWNFGFTVAPYSYYSDKGGKSTVTQNKLNEGDELTKTLWQNVTEVNIEDNKFGVAWADFDFHQKILQGENSWGQSKNKVPLGAGPYTATDRSDSTQPQATGFVDGNTVYFKANPNFSLDGKTTNKPKIEHMHYEVTAVSNALSSLESGQVHFVSPQFTGNNIRTINELKARGAGSVDSWQLGYGYIGINAGEVKNINLRMAIMSALDARLALEYYETGTAVNIAFPMSAVNWAYPRSAGNSYDGANPTANMEINNGKSYTQFTNDEDAKAKIRDYMAKAGNPSGDELKFEFTIAGSNMYDHPAYLVFKKAMELLNDCGWQVSLKPDANALTKLATGSLAVWAAAWGSTIDPDMYQVYHKNSTATSVIAWGYDDILADRNTYSTEYGILQNLSDVIDDAREVDSRETRTQLYRKALGYVLDLAVEFPLYQRKVLYAYNLNVIKESSLPHKEDGSLLINPYTSPLSRIWEVEFA